VAEASRVPTDPRAAVAAVAGLLEAAGEHLLPGDRILGGGLTHEPVAAGDTVEASIEGLGSVSVEIVA
jgi:2-keto-4-pentenoate hydratase